MTDLEKAKKLLNEGGYTAALVCREETRTSKERGIRPLLAWYREKTEAEKGRAVEESLPLPSGFSAADRVVGRGAAFLYVLLGAAAVYAAVISRPALSVLTENGIAVSYGALAENIRNRAGDGICPFEEAVLFTDDPVEALTAILRKMEEFGIPIPSPEKEESI